MSPVSLGHIECTPNGKGWHQSKLLNGKGVGWLGIAWPASNVEYAGVRSPASPSSLESAGMRPRPGGGTTRVRCSLAVSCAMDARNAAWVTSSQCLTLRPVLDIAGDMPRGIGMPVCT